MMREGACNAQDFEEPVGRHYDLPMVSYRDALGPELKQNLLKWK